jgi:endonuclease YncB( thermonuclease family)
MTSWEQYTRFNTEPLDLVGLYGPCRVVSVHDGDTMKVVTRVFPDEFRMLTLRLAGIDTPEIRGGGPAETALAVRARDSVLRWLDPELFADPLTASDIQSRLDSTPVIATVECLGQDKYGRELARLHNERGCINDVLVKEDNADAYDGKTKPPRTWDCGSTDEK